MIPGEYRVKPGSIELNQGRRTVELVVANHGDRPVQVGSHYCFFEVNRALHFNREEALGMRLDIPAGTAVRFEPGEEKPVRLVEIGGAKTVYGLNGLTDGPSHGVDAATEGDMAEGAAMSGAIRERLTAWEARKP